MSKDFKYFNIILNQISKELKKAGLDDASYLASLAAYSAYPKATLETKDSSNIVFSSNNIKKAIVQ
ncbi:MAG: hypothetical protein GY804_01300 [Alphaproteobacteria bacterium]|nr:hypothetical protein [Alphaproteobacteria bacterium]